MQRRGQVLYRLDKHLLLFYVVLPHTLAVAVELDASQFQFETDWPFRMYFYYSNFPHAKT